MYCWTAKCLTAGLCASILYGAATSNVQGQTFRYEPKARADYAAPSYASPDPAPRMMHASEAVGPASARYERGYLAPRDGRGRMAQRVRYDAPSPYQSRLQRGVPHPARAESIAPGRQVEPFGEELPIDNVNDPSLPGQEFSGDPPPSGPHDDYNAQYADEYGDDYSGGCNSCGGMGNCGGCDRCGPTYGDLFRCFTGCMRQTYLCSPRMRENLSLYTGKQAFKGPTDEGLNGDFGFHFGLNWGSPFWNRYGIGFQIGGAILASDFEGNSGPLGSKRTQSYVTTGLFRRAQGYRGFQGGVVFDYLHDDFYVAMDLMQIRGELSYVFKHHELGFWFATHTNSDTQTAPSFLDQQTVTWQANDQYNIFYRYQFCNGAVARTWAGLSSHGDGIFGGDGTVPLSPKWAVATSYNYLLPRSDASVPSNTKESWNLTISLVWYPGYRQTCDWFNPYRPLIPVADNGWFMETVK
jgi:hypothetical protein